LRQLGKEVQGVEHVKVFLEVIRVGRVKGDIVNLGGRTSLRSSDLCC
jgi:hypothetical protein